MASDDTRLRKLAAIMFTDMVGYSALSQRNEALAPELLEEQRQLLRPIFPKHQGREVKSTGCQRCLRAARTGSRSWRTPRRGFRRNTGDPHGPGRSARADRRDS